MTAWIVENKEWLFSGAGVVVLGLLIKVFLPKTLGSSTHVNVKSGNNNTHGIFNNGNNNTSSIINKVYCDSPVGDRLTILKNKTHILFIDDDGRFKVVSILQKNGWCQTRRISDVDGIDSPDIISSHILFVDIQGVGKKMQFRHEGLGLAEAIKNKHPEKKVVIYSAEDNGERFHSALRKADDFLSKNADPYEFQKLTENLAEDYWNSEIQAK